MERLKKAYKGIRYKKAKALIFFILTIIIAAQLHLLFQPYGSKFFCLFCIGAEVFGAYLIIQDLNNAKEEKQY